MPKRFWMCLVPGKSASTVRHETKDEAVTEAVRLADKEQKEVLVLECVGTAQLGKAEYKAI